MVGPLDRSKAGRRRGARDLLAEPGSFRLWLIFGALSVGGVAFLIAGGGTGVSVLASLGMLVVGVAGLAFMTWALMLDREETPIDPGEGTADELVYEGSP